jgi:hypothetical protein
MAKNTHTTARLPPHIMTAVAEHAKHIGTTKTEAMVNLMEAGLTNLNRAEDLKNLIIRQVEKLEKKQEFESKKSFEILKNQAVIEAFLLKLLIVVKAPDDEIAAIKQGAITKFINEIRG